MRTVLIIDDDTGFRRLLAETLSVHGWHVREASTGERGIALAKRHQPRFVLCDLMMPRGNGFQVCRSLSASPALCNTRIIVTSGRDFPADRKAAHAAGAEAYLTKPLDLARLLVVLESPPKPSRSRRRCSTIKGVAVFPREAEHSRPCSGALPRGTGAESAAPPAWLRFWGVRGSVPTPGRSTVRYGGNTTCVEVRIGKEIIVLDAGTGLRLLGRALVEEFKRRPLSLTLLLTHTHWDHIQGLPFFAPLYEPRNHLHILGYEGARQGLATILSNQMENPYFPVGLDELPSNVRIEELRGLSFTIGAVRVEACYANHPGVCMGYRLYAGERSLAFFPDNEPRRPKRIAPPSGRGRAARVAAFAREEDRKLVEFLRDVDVLIMDTQFDCREYRSHLGWGHGCVDDVVALALEANAKRLFLFHHDPTHDDAKIACLTRHARELVAQSNGRLRVDAAREGWRVSWSGGGRHARR